MKKLLLASLMLIASIGANSQTRPIQIYNGTGQPITVSALLVAQYPSCGSISTSLAPNVTIAPNSLSPVYNPISPGNPNVAWAGAKIYNEEGTMLAIHPFFDPCLFSSVYTPSMSIGLWFPVASGNPVQILRVF